jgi:RNA polymerase subunit RPABC4/transcription elongation factor Spt4
MSRWWVGLLHKFGFEQCAECGRLIRRGQVICNVCLDRGR